MGSNTEEIDLIEYAMGSTGQYYPEGTGRKLPAGGLFRFAPHYHPWGEETIDRQKVGIKFYPRGRCRSSSSPRTASGPASGMTGS